MSASASSKRLGLIAFAITTLVWGSTWLAIKDQLGAVPPEWSVTWRFALAGLGMFALAVLRGESLRLGREQLGLVLAVGFFQFFLNFQMVYQAERHLTSGLVAVLFALLIVPNAVLGRVVLGNRISLRFAAGSLIAIAGIALLILHEYRSAPTSGSVLLGLALTSGSIMSASIANVLQAGERARGIGILALLAWAMLVGTLTDAAWAWIMTGPPMIDLSPRYLLGVGYLGLIGSVLTFPLYAILLRDWGPGRAAYNGVLIPVVAMTLSTLFEGYQWTALAACGAVLAVAGLVVALGGRK